MLLSITCHVNSRQFCLSFDCILNLTVLLCQFIKILNFYQYSLILKNKLQAITLQSFGNFVVISYSLSILFSHLIYSIHLVGKNSMHLVAWNNQAWANLSTEYWQNRVPSFVQNRVSSVVQNRVVPTFKPCNTDYHNSS